MVDLPKGYITPRNTTEPSAFAVDSQTLSENGEVHMGNGTRAGFIESGIGVGNILGYHDTLNKFVEFSIKDDPRLEELKVYAREQGALYADPSSSEYIADVQKREKTITDLLTPKVFKTYGSYSDDTKKDRSAEEKRADGGLLSSRQTAQFKNMKSGITKLG